MIYHAHELAFLHAIQAAAIVVGLKNTSDSHGELRKGTELICRAHYVIRSNQRRGEIIRSIGLDFEGTPAVVAEMTQSFLNWARCGYPESALPDWYVPHFEKISSTEHFLRSL